MKLKRFSGNPVLGPNPKNKWENLATSNPGVIYDNGKFFMLYRAAGDDAKHTIRFGLAESLDGFHFKRVSDKPVFVPSKDGPDSGCVEDPRIIKMENEFYITYAYRPFPPGRYWTFAHDVVLKPDCGKNAPRAIKDNLGNSGLAVTSDFKAFRRLGRITSSNLDDRDVIIFPEKINGSYVMLHRPKEYTGKKYGVKYPSIWLKRSEDLLDWEGKPSELLLAGRENSWEEKIGAAAPPLKTDRGWLMLYHGVEHGGLGYYRTGALLLDLNDPLRILGKTEECILEPEEKWELEGLYNGCVFPTGNVIRNGILYVYYGAADKYIGVATAVVDDLLDHICK